MARTAKQRAALRKAQLASARKRKGKGKSKTSTVSRRKRGVSAKTRRRRTLAVASAVGAVAYVSSYKLAANYAARRQRDFNREYQEAMGEWARRRARYNQARSQARSQAKYSNVKQSRPRFVPSTRGPGMPLNPQRALPRPQLALPRGRS